MHELYKLKDMLSKELEEYAKSGAISKSSLDTIDKLAHATKNVAKVIECSEKEGYSNAYGRPYGMDRSYADDRSYGRDASYGYSRKDDSMKEDLYRLLNKASDEGTREEIRRLINRY